MLNFEKEHAIDELKQALVGKNNNIYTIAIVSIENQTEKSISKKEETRNKFERMLRDGNYNYTKIKGSYGETDFYYVIYNISLNTVMLHMESYKQELFIFIKKLVYGNGVLMQYWQKDFKVPQSPYKIQKNFNHTNGINDDFFARFPFVFDANNVILDKDVPDPFTRLQRIHSDAERNFIKDFTDGNLVGMSTFYRHGTLYKKHPSSLINNTENTTKNIRHNTNVCLITAFQPNKNDAENTELNDKLKFDLSRLGYNCFTQIEECPYYDDSKICYANGFKVYSRTTANQFKEDMLALAKYYNISVILLKPKRIPAAYYYSLGENAGKIYSEFDIKKFTNGNRISLTDEEYNKMPLPDGIAQGLTITSGNGWISRGMLRKELGLETWYTPNKTYNICFMSAENNDDFRSLGEMLSELRYKHFKIINTNNRGVNEYKLSFNVVDIYDKPEVFIERMKAIAKKFDIQDIIIKTKNKDEIVRYSVADSLWVENKLDSEADNKLSQIMTIPEERIDKLYLEPYSRYGRDFSVLSQAHIAYCVLKQDLGLQDCSHGKHPYGETYTCEEAKKCGWVNPLDD